MAKAAGVHGFVRNRADGAVEAEFEGSEAAVERMIAWCRIGPARAHVGGVEIEPLDPGGAPTFRIR
jgi:acylphosphatase